MRFHPIFLLFFLAITVQAQRRTTAKSDISSETPRPSRSRGRSRFVATPEYQSFQEAPPTPSEPVSRRIVSRKRVPEPKTHQPAATETIERRSFLAAQTPERRAPRPPTEPTERKTAFVAAEIPERRATRPATEATERRTAFAAAEIPERRSPRPVTEATERRALFTAAETPERRAPRPATEATERRAFKKVQKTIPGASYAVEEVVDEGIQEPFRKFKKTRVLTESHFEAQNLPRRNSIPAASEYPESPRSTSVRTVKKLVHHEPTSPIPPPTEEADDSNSIDEPLDTTLKTPSVDSSSEESTSEETKEEIFKTQPIITTPKSLESPRQQNGNRRGSIRKNQNTFTEATSQASRSRTRTRGTKAPEFAFQAATIPSRGSRRRVESSKPLVEGSRVGPSVFSAELVHNEGRSRTGRKIEVSTPEKISLELPSRVAAREKSREQNSRRKPTTKRTVDDPIKRTSPSSTFPSRGRSRSRDVPPIIDESKLEVLPLFETEPKIVNTGSITRSRSRDTNRADDIAIESKIKTESNEVDTPVYTAGTRTRGSANENFLTSATEDDIKISKPDRVTVSVSESRTLFSQTDPTSHRSPVRESVVSEVSEITSRRTVLRRKNLRGAIKPIETKPKILVGKLVPGSRGNRKSEINLNAVAKKKAGSEEIDEADNYPEPFKALIKAKKGKKDSRPSSEISAITNIVTPPSTNTKSVAESVKEINDQENELEPKSPTSPTPPSRSTRNRPSYSSTTSRSSASVSDRRAPNKKSTVEVKSTPSTLFTTPLSRLNKYKGKHAAPSSRNLTSQKFDRNVSFRPREGYSTERKKKGAGYSGRRVVKNADEPKPPSTKIPKYSTSYTTSDRSKYRNEFSRGAVVRSTTNAPRYIPTIPSAPYVPTVPTVTPSRTTVFESGEKDPDLGLEVISFNDPVRPVQSANLISDDYVSSTANSLSVALPLVTDGTTEKPVSIIERIINSITAISTSSPPSAPPSTASTTESASAILKLAPKKTKQLDSTDVTQTYATTDKATTEKPTTIIERILSSLNAIQATDNTSSAQVDQSTRPTNAGRALSLDSFSTSTTPTETNIASSRTPQSTIRTESRFAIPDASGTTSTQGTTTYTPSGTTSTTSGTTSSTRGSALGPDSTTSSSSSTPEVTTAEGSTTVGSMPADMVTLESSTVLSSTLGSDTNPTLETLSQLLLNGRTLEAFNDIVNSAQTSTTDTDTYQTPQGDQLDLTTAPPPSSTIASTTTEQSTTSTVGTSKAATTPSASKAESTTMLPDTVTLSNDILGDQSSDGTVSTTTRASTTTTALPTTTASTTTTDPTTTIQQRYTSTPVTTTLSVPTPKPTTISTLPSPTTFFPAFFTTLFPGLFTTETPVTKARSTRAPQVVRISAAPSVTEAVTVAARTTRAPTTTIRTTTRATTTTTDPTTTIRQTTTTRLTTTTSRESTTTTTTEPTTTTLEATIASTTTKRSEPVTNLNTIEITTVKKTAKKQLTEEQKENLRTLQKLEEEQAALLKQLSFLTSLNFGGANPGSKRTSKASKVDKPANDNLAERVIELALQRDKSAKTTTSDPTTTKHPTSIQDQLAAIDEGGQPRKASPSIEDVLKQYNLSDLDIATTPKSTAYGKSTDAILASILKEQGIAPPTPKSLGDQIKQSGIFETTTRRPKPKPKPTTQRPPGPLMQGLNWLLNALAPAPAQPPPAKKQAKPVKPKKPPVQQELLANSPTHITPVVTPAPAKSSVKQPANALTQDDIQKLIKQLEGLQKDPSKGALDLSQIKSIQNLINTDEGVVVMTNGEHGATSRRTTTPRSATTPRRQERKLATRAPLLTVSNSVEDIEEVVPTTPKPMRPPIGFRPVPGVDDDSSESLIRSNLITAAVNVTKAISGFLGTALQTVSQGAAQSFQSLLGSGSSLGTRVLGNAASGSSAGPT